MSSLSTIDISEESLVQMAELHMAAFHGYPNTRMGLGYVVALIRWFCEAEDALALCAIDKQGRHLGSVVETPMGYSSRMKKALIWRAARGILTQPMHLTVYPENKAALGLCEKARWKPLLDTITPSDAVCYYKTTGRRE